MKPGTIALVEWEDSATEVNSLGWQSARALRKALKKEVGTVVCHSVGFVVHDGKRCISLAAGITLEGQANHVIHIPRSAVRGTKVLQKP